MSQKTENMVLMHTSSWTTVCTGHWCGEAWGYCIICFEQSWYIGIATCKLE